MADNEIIRAWEAFKKKNSEKKEIKKELKKEAKEKKEEPKEEKKQEQNDLEKEASEADEPIKQQNPGFVSVLPEKAPSLDFEKRSLEEAVGNFTRKNDNSSEKEEKVNYSSDNSRKYERAHMDVRNVMHDNPVFERERIATDFRNRLTSGLRVEMNLPSSVREMDERVDYDTAKSLKDERMELEGLGKKKYKIEGKW